MDNEQYKKDELKEYIKSSEIRKFKNIKIRLSKELAVKFDNGDYDKYLEFVNKCYELLNTLEIKYPSNAKPTLYLYIVPDDRYVELLRFPLKFNKGHGGGKPVHCYDLDGFPQAYGISQNMCENFEEDINNISKFVNELHELSHIITSIFSPKSLVLDEGLAETLPLYGLGLEEMFTSHKDSILNLTENQIYTAQELLNQSNDNTYGIEELVPNRSCSFRLSYISSYLLVRGCIEQISELLNLGPKESIQYFLELIKTSIYMEEWLIYDIADNLKIDKEVLLNTKTIELNAIKNMTTDHRSIKK